MLVFCGCVFVQRVFLQVRSEFGMRSMRRRRQDAVAHADQQEKAGAESYWPMRRHVPLMRGTRPPGRDLLQRGVSKLEDHVAELELEVERMMDDESDSKW